MQVNNTVLHTGTIASWYILFFVSYLLLSSILEHLMSL